MAGVVAGQGHAGLIRFVQLKEATVLLDVFGGSDDAFGDLSVRESGLGQAVEGAGLFDWVQVAALDVLGQGGEAAAEVVGVQFTAGDQAIRRPVGTSAGCGGCRPHQCVRS